MVVATLGPPGPRTNSVAATEPQLMWQGSLFGSRPPAPDPAAKIQRTDLTPRSWVDYSPLWMHGADQLLDQLTVAIPWSSYRRPMYDRMVDVPRLSWFGAVHNPLMPATITDIAQALHSIYGVRFNSVGLNLYRDGNDSVAWHRDRVGRRIPFPLVAIVSLGVGRPFSMRSLGGGGTHRWSPGEGDLLVMGGACQHELEHSVPKIATAAPRLSISFRHG